MADLIDYIVFASQDKAKGRKFFAMLAKTKKGVDLEKWFVKEGFTGISLEECEKIVKNKEDLLHKGDVLTNNKSNY